MRHVAHRVCWLSTGRQLLKFSLKGVGIIHRLPADLEVAGLSFFEIWLAHRQVVFLEPIASAKHCATLAELPVVAEWKHMLRY